MPRRQKIENKSLISKNKSNISVKKTKNKQIKQRKKRRVHSSIKIYCNL